MQFNLPELYSQASNGNGEPKEYPIDPRLWEVLKKRRIEGLLGDAKYRIGTSDAQLTYPIGQGHIRGILDYDGGLGLQAQHPLWGGLLKFKANNLGTDQANYMLNGEWRF